MRWTLVCIFRTPHNPGEAARAAASQLNQITAALSYSSQPLAGKLLALVKYVFCFAVFPQLFFFLPGVPTMSPSDEMSKWLGVSVMRPVGRGWGWGGGGWLREKRKWPTLIYPGCSLVWLVPFPTPRCIPFPPIISTRSPQSNEFPTGS